MFHASNLGRSAQGDAIHPRWCRCSACVRPTRSERIMARLQAALLCAFLIAIYGLALYSAPAIAISFGWRL